MFEIDNKFTKYSKPEVERKFLLKELPKEAILHSEITDWYITDTTLRLRKAKTQNETVYKLGQKIRVNPDSTRTILHTNIYLTKSEFGLMLGLPSKQLTKKRYQMSIGDLSVWIDEFGGSFAGLLIAEIDFKDLNIASSFSMPSFFDAEVTDDERFTGGTLASTGGDTMQGR